MTLLQIIVFFMLGISIPSELYQLALFLPNSRCALASDTAVPRAMQQRAWPHPACCRAQEAGDRGGHDRRHAGGARLL